jgi:nitrogen fixation protein FixH
MKDETVNPAQEKQFELTGKHVFAIVATAFSVVIGVNLVMAYVAIETFPGLETKNSYVASQEFDAQRTAQDALGWQVDANVLDEILVLDVKDTQDRAVEVASIYGLLGRATHVKEDQEPTFTKAANGTYTAQVGALGTGNWNLRLNMISQDGTSFQRRIPIFIKAQ